ncbi:MAG: type III-B CRISPR module RAMP protein Cmr4 [Clostridiales bacterium]|nr:type III-B CRISPR module RAMP protein Cmr4 [Clostridiales bacterium]
MATYKRQRYLFMVTDPVHIGTGGYRLGRVDNSIVREPGTRVPKIPGTSLHGAARTYAAQLYENPEAAGQNHEAVDHPDQNPVCYTFGYIKPDAAQDNKTRAYSGVVNIFDAHILAFPVYSMVGPVWVSSYERLSNAGFTIKNSPRNGSEEKDWTPPNNWEPDKVFLSWQRSEPLNLGWLMLTVSGRITVTPPENWNKTAWKEAAKRLVLVQESLFSQVVNSNLEVRTSVAIDPWRGAAEEGALFTYEAIPRATFLTADVVLDDYREAWPLNENCNRTLKGNLLPGEPWSGPLAVVKAGLRMIEWLGVGGMGTRGFGRMVIVGDPVEEEYEKGGGQ